MLVYLYVSLCVSCIFVKISRDYVQLICKRTVQRFTKNHLDSLDLNELKQITRTAKKGTLDCVISSKQLWF